MVADPQTEQPTYVTEIQQLLGGITGLDVQNDLIRATELGGLSFAEAQQLFEAIIAYCNRLASLPWGMLPEPSVTPIKTRIEHLTQTLNEIRKFTYEQADPSAQRRALIEQLRDRFQQIKVDAHPAIGYLSWETIDLGAVRARVEGVINEVTQKAAAITKEIEERRDEADKALQAIRTAAAESGVAYHAEVFKATGDEHAKRARWWLITSGVLSVAVVIAAVLLVVLWDVNGEISDASTFQLVVVKGVALAVGFYALVNVTRIYRAEAHLAIVSRHREDALKTFQEFVAGTETQEVKDAVLLEATHAVFSLPSTGLIDGKDRADTLEILDGVTNTLRRRS